MSLTFLIRLSRALDVANTTTAILNLIAWCLYGSLFNFALWAIGRSRRMYIAVHAPGECSYCHGNDRDAPCAYPSEGKPGCLRDARLAWGATP